MGALSPTNRPQLFAIPLFGIAGCLMLFVPTTRYFSTWQPDPDRYFPEVDKSMATHRHAWPNAMVLNVIATPSSRPGDSPDPLVTALVKGRDAAPTEIKISHADDRPLERILRAKQRERSGKLQVIIRAESEIPYYQLEKVFAACQAAGVDRFDLKVDPMGERSKFKH